MKRRVLMAIVFGVVIFGLQFPQASDRANAAQVFCASGNVTCLVAAISEANAKPGNTTINLEPGIYIVNSATGTGTAGLPTIGSSIRIRGSNTSPSIIRRDPADPFISVIDVSASGKLNLQGMIVQAPTILGFGGVAISNYGDTRLENSIVSDSTGAIYNTGKLTILRSIIANNFYFFGTGGVDNAGGTVLLQNSTIAHSGGGGFAPGAIENSGVFRVVRSAIVFNFSAGDVFNGPVIGNSGTLDIVNTTIAENFAHYGHVIGNQGQFTITNSTMQDNETFSEGAFPPIGWLAGTIQIINTIVTKNTSSSGCSGTIASLGNNFFDEPGNLGGCTISLQSNDLTGNDPGLGSLIGTGDDDPPGRVFYPVLLGSVVIGKGNRKACPRIDQLGNRRHQFCDIGSIEFIGGPQ